MSGTQRLDCIHVDSIRLMLDSLFSYDGMNGTDGCRQALFIPAYLILSDKTIGLHSRASQA